MKKFVLIFAICAAFISCSSVVVPNYKVDYSDEGRENRRIYEEQVAELKKSRQKVKLTENYDDSGNVINGGEIQEEEEKMPEKSLLEVSREKVVRIVHISDFHSSSYGINNDTLIKKIQDAKPDLIVLTGDIFDFKTSFARPVQNVRYLIDGIKDIAPFYYVSGDTEFYSYHECEFNHLITDNGGIILEGKAVELSVPLGKIILAGLPDPYIDMTIDERSHNLENREKYLERIENLKVETENLQKKSGKVLFTALLAHRPEYIDEYKAAGCFDLVLSGHTNGGIWKFGDFMKGLYAKNQGFFPKYAGGLYEFFDEPKPSALVISRGLSYQKLSLPRVGTNPELVVIDVVPHESRF